MSEFDELEQGVGGYDPDPAEGLNRTMARVGRRRRTRRLGAVAVSLTLFSATLGAAVWVSVNSELTGRPLGGPTPTPTPTVRLGEGTTWCSDGPVGPDVERHHCITQAGKTVAIASGNRGRTAWSMEAFRAVYQGTPPEGNDRDGDLSVTLPMQCWVWRFADRPTGICQAKWENGIVGIEGFFYGEGEAPHVLFPSGAAKDPLPGVTRGGFGLPAADEELASWFWTPDTTARVEVSIDGAAPEDAPLFGPFEALGTEFKWGLTFIPTTDVPVRRTAYDADGTVLWSEDVRR